MRSLNLKLRSSIAQRKSEESGIALVELLVAITVLVGILTATAMALMQGLTIQSQNNQYNQAVQVAQIELDKAKSLTYPNLGFAAADRVTGTKFITLPDASEVSINYTGSPVAASTSASPMKMTRVQSQSLTEGALVTQDYTLVTTINYATDYYATAGHNTTLGCPAAKIVHVQVYWRDASGAMKSTGLKYTKSPDVHDCAPPNVNVAPRPAPTPPSNTGGSSGSGTTTPPTGGGQTQQPPGGGGTVVPPGSSGPGAN